MKNKAKVSTLLISSALITNMSFAADLNLSQTPLFLNNGQPPLTLLVMGKNHKLFYEAYNDASDLDGDGVLDIRYNPSITYYGYFDSYKCYSYNSNQQRFIPKSTTSDKRCSGNRWSGDYLNYLTTSRMDAIRKVLYGGKRSTDTNNVTVLERAYIPQDAHSWGKEYSSISDDGYDIQDYTPLGLPSSGTRHLFANTTLLSGDQSPLLRVLTNETHRIWEWVSIERPVAGSRVEHGGSGPQVSPTDYVVRAKVCVAGLLEDNCKLYPNGKYKPTGLLQEFGENDSMYFGLITGSYGKNLSGGVLRKQIDSITDEINANNGRLTDSVGIIKTIDRIRIPNFGGSYVHQSSCGFIFNRKFNEGECRSWGNPIAEMMYEGMRYFAGKGSPTSSFTYSGGDDSTLGLPQASWNDPYDSNENPWCAKPNMLVISDINPSYDTDNVPGSAFSSFSGDLNPSLNANSLAGTIWQNEQGGSSSHFIGETTAAAYDGAPTAKTVGSFGTIRGFVEEPAKEGGYYSASVAYYGRINDISAAQNTQEVNTFAVALSSPLPRIRIPVDGGTVTLIPFAKSVGGCGGINSSQGQFQPTDTIVDFYVEEITPTTGRFRINFEDVEQGADHDMDAIVEYNYTVNGDNTVTITLNSQYAAGCIIQHMGYVISGTTADGPYLEVRDTDTSSGSDTDYFLDTPNNSSALPLTATRTFTPSSSPAATTLTNPLWYAAKWGGFIDQNNNDLPDQADEWDSDGDGTPDNYFLVTNALTLSAQLGAAFDNILSLSSSASASAVNGGVLNTDSRVYQAVFNSQNWIGQLLAFSINSSGQVITTGSGPSGSIWDAGTIIGTQNHNTGREIITYKVSSDTGIPFRWPSNPSSPSATEMDSAQSTLLNTDSLGSTRLNYLRGDDSNEVSNGGSFRNRTSKLGDIVNSAPLHIGAPNFNYPDIWPSGAPENNIPYSEYKASQANRQEMIYVGANDGMLHAIDAQNGDEELAYVPSPVYANLKVLSDTDYSHKFHVDGSPNAGDAYYNNAWHTVLVGGLNAGGQGIYALDITNPSTFDESNAASIVMWEFTDSDDADLGYTYSQPAVARMANGQWAAIFGNGYNNTELDGNASSTGNAVLYIVNIQTGALIKKIDTLYGMEDDPTTTGRPNGLATPTLVDFNGDGIVEYIYAGDLYGNMWKFDVQNSDPANWSVAYGSASTPEPLFDTFSYSGSSRAITTRPSVRKMNNGTDGLQILFGTGKYLEVSDKDVSNAVIESFFGIEDNHSTPVYSISELVQQSILSETTYTSGSTTYDVRVTTNNLPLSYHRGWYMNFTYNGSADGERQVSNSVLRNDKIIFTTLIPSSDVCSFGGTGWLMSLDAATGGRLGYSPFDLNGDSLFNDSDYVTYSEGEDSIQVPVSGKKSQVGIIPVPGIVSTGEIEYLYTPGSTGTMETTVANPGPFTEGRQSWRQLK